MKICTNQLAAVSLSLLLLVAGCVSNYEPIEFFSQPRPPSSVLVRPEVPGLSQEDENLIHLAVYSLLLERNVGKNAEASALFLVAEEEVVTALIKKFPSHVPPLKPASSADLKPHQAPRDRDTGKTAMIFAAEVGAGGSDGTVPVVVRWHDGLTVKETWSFVLKKRGDAWEANDVKMANPAR